MTKACRRCGLFEDLRGGFCFDCCTEAETRVLARTVRQHLGSALQHVRRALGYAWAGGWPEASTVWLYARIDTRWAIERLIGTGVYRKRNVT